MSALCPQNISLVRHISFVRCCADIVPILCGHCADIYLQGYVSAQCPRYILLRFSALVDQRLSLFFFRLTLLCTGVCRFALYFTYQTLYRQVSFLPSSCCIERLASYLETVVVYQHSLLCWYVGLHFTGTNLDTVLVGKLYTLTLYWQVSFLPM